MKNYPCEKCGGGHNESECNNGYEPEPNCYDCRFHDEDFCVLFKKYIGSGFDELQADDCGEFSRAD